MTVYYKFYGAVNTVVSRLGGVCSSDKVWMTIVEKQLFPVLAYGSHLWNYGKSSIVKKINAAYRRGIRKGLGMAQRESVCQRLSGMFEEASVELKRDQLKFLIKESHAVTEQIGHCYVLVFIQKLLLYRNYYYTDNFNSSGLMYSEHKCNYNDMSAWLLVLVQSLGCFGSLYLFIVGSRLDIETNCCCCTSN